MKPSPFEYVRAASLDHAVEVLAAGNDVAVLAGGQSLLPILNLRLAAPTQVLDIGRLSELGLIEVSEADPGGTTLRIGAAVTQTEAAEHPTLREQWPLLADALGHIGHPQIRNRGTVGGSLAHGDPQAELPAVALAGEAKVHLRSAAGTRVVEAEDFFQGPFLTGREDDELLTAVEFPEPPPGQGWSFRELATRPGDFATAGVAVTLARGPVSIEARVVVFGVGSRPERATAIETALADAEGPALDPSVLEQWAASVEATSDVQASAGARIAQARTLLTLAVAEAWERMQ